MNNLDKVRSALRRLDLSDNQQAVYLSLLSAGATTARVLSSRTGITRPSVYDQIKTLQQMNLVAELEIENTAHFAATDIKNLNALLADKIDRLEQSRDILAEALPSLRDSLATVDPKLRFFAGEEGVKQLLKDIMWYSNNSLQMYWPAKEMGTLFDTAFLTWFDERRAKRHLSIHSLWPANTHKSDLNLFCSLPHDTQRRLLKCAPPAMAYIIYDKKVLFISSKAEAFGFIVESTEFATLQKLHFDTLWKSSR